MHWLSPTNDVGKKNYDKRFGDEKSIQRKCRLDNEKKKIETVANGLTMQ